MAEPLSEEEVEALREARTELKVMRNDAITMQQELQVLRKQFLPSGGDLANRMKAQVGLADGTKLQRIINNLEPVIDAIDWNINSISTAIELAETPVEVEL